VCRVEREITRRRDMRNVAGGVLEQAKPSQAKGLSLRDSLRDSRKIPRPVRDDSGTIL
jgi:hypothetical protein